MEFQDRKKFFGSKGLERLAYLQRRDRIQVIFSIIIAAASLIFTIFTSWDFLTEWFKSIVSSANAATEGSRAGATDYGPAINLGIMAVIGLAFIWSLGVCMHSDNEERVKTASDINKMLLGFFIGSGKSIIGL